MFAFDPDMSISYPHQESGNLSFIYLKLSWRIVRSLSKFRFMRENLDLRP